MDRYKETVLQACLHGLGDESSGAYRIAHMQQKLKEGSLNSRGAPSRIYTLIGTGLNYLHVRSMETDLLEE